jgi:hypothetical protein
MLACQDPDQLSADAGSQDPDHLPADVSMPGSGSALSRSCQDPDQLLAYLEQIKAKTKILKNTIIKNSPLSRTKTRVTSLGASML